MTAVEDRWVVAEGLHDDRPLVIRYRVVTPALLQDRPHLIRICWDFGPGMDGLPHGLQGTRHDLFEGRLIDGIEREGCAVLAVVITNDGKRDFYLFGDDVRGFVDRFHGLPQEDEPYPVQIEVTRNESSAFYRGIVASCSGG